MVMDGSDAQHPGTEAVRALPPPELWRDRLQRFEVQSIAAEGRRHAAVALVLAEAGHGAEIPGLPRNAAWSTSSALLLTRRSAGLRAHAGQWALPGGRIDKGETPELAALRELHEEIADPEPGARRCTAGAAHAGGQRLDRSAHCGISIPVPRMAAVRPPDAGRAFRSTALRLALNGCRQTTTAMPPHGVADDRPSVCGPRAARRLVRLETWRSQRPHA